MNLGGPGWFKDVLEVKIVYLSDKSGVPSGSGASEAEPCEMFTTAEPITGNIVVTAPPKCTVWHYGVVAKLDATMSCFESLSTRCLFTQEVQVAAPGYVTGSVTIPFRFELKGHHAYDSYEGSHFSIRHGVLVTVLRPWYTFDIIAYASFILQTVTDESEVAASLEWQSPDEKDVEDADASAGAGAGESKTEASVDTTSHHVLVIPDCHGICEFDFIKPTYSIDSVLHGKITMRELKEPVVRLELMLLRMESGDFGNFTSLLFQEALIDNEGEGKNNEPVEGEGELDISLDLSLLALGPSILCDGIPSDGPDDQNAVLHPDTSVRYFIRVVVFTDVKSPSGKFWSTRELILFRERAEGLHIIPGTSSSTPTRHTTVPAFEEHVMSASAPNSPVHRFVKTSDAGKELCESPV